MLFIKRVIPAQAGILFFPIRKIPFFNGMTMKESGADCNRRRFLYRHGGLDVRMRLIADQFKILELEVEDIGDVRVEMHFGQRVGRA